MRRIIALKYAVADVPRLPDNWLFCEQLSDIVNVCSEAPNSSVILALEQMEGFAELVRTVYMLRLRFGEKLSIIVRELKVRLRYQDEAMLGTCGVSLIVPSTVDFPRFLSMVEIAGYQNFGVPLPADVENAIAGGAPNQSFGYLSPSRFLRQVQETILRSQLLSIDNAIVELSLVNGLRPMDVLRHCRLHRCGDFVTADRSHLWLFFHACREFDLEQTISRVFALPIDELCSAEQRYLTTYSIQGFLDQFPKEIAKDGTLDLSAQLQAHNFDAQDLPRPRLEPRDNETSAAPAVLAPPTRTPLRVR